MSSTSNRRRATRIPVRIPAKVHIKGTSEALDAEVLDISVGGAFIHCTAPITLGQEVVLEIRYEDTEVIEGKIVELEKIEKKELPPKATERSVVRWVRGSSRSGFGVEFLSLPMEKQKFVERLSKYLRED